MIQLSRRVETIEPSATLAIDAEVKALKAAGQEVISFGVGEPDLPPPDHVIQAAARACSDLSNHRYSPAAGKAALRAAVAERVSRTSGRPTEPAEVVICNGGKQAISNAFLALLDPSDEVLVAAPYWTTYPESVRIAGGVPVIVEADAQSGFLATVDDFEVRRTSRTKAVVVVSPGNPTGSVYTADQLAAIAQWAVRNDLWIISDEIYQDFVYAGEFVGVASAYPEAVDNLVLVDGIAKSYSMTGWRVGWVTAPRPVAEAITSLQSHMTSNVNNVAQDAALAALSDTASTRRTRDIFAVRRQFALGALRRIESVTCPESGGAFYLFPDVSGLFGRDIHGVHVDSSATLAGLILRHAKVGVVPGEAFGAPGHLRISYAVSDSELETGLSRIIKLINE